LGEANKKNELEGMTDPRESGLEFLKKTSSRKDSQNVGWLPTKGKKIEHTPREVHRLEKGNSIKE